MDDQRTNREGGISPRKYVRLCNHPGEQAAYVELYDHPHELAPGIVAKTIQLDEVIEGLAQQKTQINLDFDSDGVVIGIELLRYGDENQIPHPGLPVPGSA
jgi:hypothetical protein